MADLEEANARTEELQAQVTALEEGMERRIQEALQQHQADATEAEANAREARENQRRSRYGQSASQKLAEYASRGTAMGNMLKRVGLRWKASMTAAEELTILEKYEVAVSYQSAALPGLADHKDFYMSVRESAENCSSSASKMDTAFGRAEVQVEWNAANDAENAKVANLGVDDSESQNVAAVEHGKFGKFWSLFRDAFVNQEKLTWQFVHNARFSTRSAPAPQKNSEKSITEYCSRAWRKQGLLEDRHSELPTDNPQYLQFISAFQANTLVADCDPTLSAAMYSHPEYKKLILPENIHKWDFQTIYDAMRVIETTPSYAQAADEKRKLRTATQASSARVNALAQAQGSSGSSHQGAGKSGGGNFNGSQSAGRSEYVYSAREWTFLKSWEQDRIIEEKKRISAKPLVAGADGKIHYHHRMNGKQLQCEAGDAGAKVEQCFWWSREKKNGSHRHCKNPGHFATNCPQFPQQAQVNGVSGAGAGGNKKKKKKVPKAEPVVANVGGGATLEELNAFQVNILKAVQRVAGGDSEIDQMISDASQVRAVVTVGAMGLRTKALTVTLDDGREVLLDTGSLHTIITWLEWHRLHAAGGASALVEKTDGITFISASGDDLGYTHWAVVYLPVANELKPVVCRVVTNMEPSFPFLLGMDGLTACGGIVNFVDSLVTFRSDAGEDLPYDFEGVEPQSPYLPEMKAFNQSVFNHGVVGQGDAGAGASAAESSLKPRAPVFTPSGVESEVTMVPQVVKRRLLGEKKRTNPGGKKKNVSKRAECRTVTGWSTVMALMVTALVNANYAKASTGFFPVEGDGPKHEAEAFAERATLAVNKVFDDSFDTTVELHSPYLDPDLPPPFSDWSPDAPSCSLSGGYDDWTMHPLANRTGCAATATSDGRPYDDGLQFTNFTNAIRTSPEAVLDQNGHAAEESPSWLRLRDTLTRGLPFSAQCNFTALDREEPPSFSSHFAGTGRADLYHPGPVLDPVDPWAPPLSKEGATDEAEMQASFDSFGGSSKNFTVSDDDGDDSFSYHFDAHGNLLRTDISSHDYSNETMESATLCYQVGVLVGDRFVPGFADTSGESCTSVPVQAVYRKVEAGDMWTQLGLDQNDWANIPRNKTILEQALKDSGDVFTSDAQGNLRRIQHADGTPIEVDIHVKPGKHHRVRAYRNGKFAREVIEKKIREFEKQGLISRAPDSTWGSSLLVVAKAGSDDVRLTVDYRGLNECIEPYAYPVCTVHDIHSRMGGSTRFSTLDMRSWFHQFTLGASSRKYTTFVTPSMGAWCWNVLPMGLNISPAIVQAKIDEIFRCTYDGPCKKYQGMSASDFCLCYCDDIVVYSDDDSHAILLNWVLSRLRQHNIEVAPKKAFLGMKRIHCLGHYIDADGLHVDTSKVDAMSKMAPPTDVTGVKRFLGASGYYRNFVQDFGTRTKHLTDLLKKANVFDWSAQCQREFDDIKQALVSAPVLALPRWDLPFTLRCDASETGIGCLLVQNIDGVRRIVCCASRKWTPCEMNYDVRRKECFGCVYGIRKFREYLQGAKFTLETDHRNLLWLSKVESHTQQLYRWALELSTVDYTVEHVSGASLMDADMLSRAPLAAEDGGIDEEEEWQRFQINAMQSATSPVTEVFKVFSIGFGIGCDVMATANTPFKVVGGCDIDEVAISHFEERTGAKCYGSIESLRQQLNAGLKLSVDVVSFTVSCASRSKWNRINKKPVEHRDGHEFTEGIDVICKIAPRMCYLEMVAGDDPSDFMEVEERLSKCFSNVQSRVMNMAKYGAYTDRRRYVCWASNCDAPMVWPTPMTKFPGCKAIMLPPADVPVIYRASHFTPRRRMPNEQDEFTCRKVGTVTKGDGSRASDLLHNRLYDPRQPMPTISSSFSYSGNKGSQWVLDSFGPRQWLLEE